MSSLFFLTWRVLLIVALVLNPVAGMAMPGGGSDAAKQEATASAAKAPPCHGMAMAAQPAAQPDAPTGQDRHGSDCGNLACQFGACCVLVALHVPALAVPAYDAGSLPPFARASHAADAPPPLRMIRPPIA